MKTRATLFLIITFSFMMMADCATSQGHPDQNKTGTPKLIPLEDIFTNKETNFGYQVSPDGKKVGWLAVDKNRNTIHYRTIGEDKVQVIDTHSPRSIYGFVWAQDSRRVLYRQDQEGDENYHIYLADTSSPKEKPVDLTPFEDTRAIIHKIIRSDPDSILIFHNQRDKRVPDLYRVNLNTLEHRLVVRNPGNVLAWITDEDGILRARITRLRWGIRTLEVADPLMGEWKRVLTWGPEDFVQVLDFTLDDKGMWLISNRGRDRVGLVRFYPETGRKELIYEDPQVDLGRVLLSRKLKRPLLVSSYPDYPKLHFMDKELKEDLAVFKGNGNADISVTSWDDNERILTVSVVTDRTAEDYLFNRDTNSKELLGRNPIHRYIDSLSRVQSIVLKSRDGLTLHGYLTIPRGFSGKGLPMVVFVHGGPWARDYWGYNSLVQFFANRGYAVLQINYRGSIGYGREFREAAVGEFAGKMHTDLIDGVVWAVERGIADPEKIGIFGASYGGYAALVGLTFTPERFACGVSLCGPSNLVSLLESVPAYWKPWIRLWYRFVGDPNNPEDRSRMEAKSPLFRVDRIKRPLLIGQGVNDPRVKQQESDQIVSALLREGMEVEYLLFPDEGHGLINWKNRLTFYRGVEDFLSRHLGGRSTGSDY